MSDLTTTTNQQFDLSPQNFDQALTFSKYLAGSELGTGVFTADTLPEDKAAELRAVEVEID